MSMLQSQIEELQRRANLLAEVEQLNAALGTTSSRVTVTRDSVIVDAPGVREQKVHSTRVSHAVCVGVKASVLALLNEIRQGIADLASELQVIEQPAAADESQEAQP